MSDCKHEHNDVSPDGAMERCTTCGVIRWARDVGPDETFALPVEWMRELRVDPTIEDRVSVEAFPDVVRVRGTFALRVLVLDEHGGATCPACEQQIVVRVPRLDIPWAFACPACGASLVTPTEDGDVVGALP